MENPNLLDKLFQYIHHPLWYRSPPARYQDPPPPPQNMDLDDSFEVDFQRLRQWAALKAHQTTPSIRWKNASNCALHATSSHSYSPSTAACLPPMWSSCHGRNLTVLWYQLMQHRRVEAESVTHKYYNSFTKPKFYKNTRLISKIIEKTSLANFYSKTHIT